MNNTNLDFNKIVSELERCVDTDGKTFVVFWLYSPTTETTGAASLTKIDPVKQIFVATARASEDILLPHIPPEPGLWEVRFTVMTFIEAKNYAEQTQLDTQFEDLWKKETPTCH